MKNHYLLGFVAVVVILFSVSVASAQIAQVAVDADVEVNTTNQGSLRNTLRAKGEQGSEKVKMLASTTRAENKDIRTETRAEIKDTRVETRTMMKNASTSAERKDIRASARADVFKAQQLRLVAQLEIALNNLKQIRARILSRIEKAEATGRSMTAGRQALATADAKFVLAEQAIASLKIYTPVASTTVSATTTATTTPSTATTTPSVDLTKPRQIGSAAIAAVKEVRKALVQVTVAVAQSMGLRCNADGDTVKCTAVATTTPPITSTTTATTTP